jgi:nucleotide-binding universal stress UspA family protein
MKAFPILVGADGTDHSKAAVRWAAREARRRNRALRVMYVYDWNAREARDDMRYYDPDVLRKRAEGVAGTVADEARRLDPDLEIEVDPVIGHPAARLVAESDGAELIVLGSRGHGVIAGSLIGSVGLHLLHHGDCPVYIARPTVRPSRT